MLIFFEYIYSFHNTHLLDLVEFVGHHLGIHPNLTNLPNRGLRQDNLRHNRLDHCIELDYSLHKRIHRNFLDVMDEKYIYRH
jgi:hypothetical protein